jgi:hypothetical protein
MSIYMTPWGSDEEFPISHDDLSHVKEHMQLVLEAAYDGTRNMDELDRSLEEIAAALDLDFCKEKKLQLQKKENPYFDLGVSLMKK